MINLHLEWRTFKNSQFGRNFTYKTRQIYERAEVILMAVLADILEADPKTIAIEEDILHRRIVSKSQVSQNASTLALAQLLSISTYGFGIRSSTRFTRTN